MFVHTECGSLVRDYLTGDGTLDRSLTLGCLASCADADLADEIIHAWELDRHDSDHPSWLEAHASRDALTDAVAVFRIIFADEA